MLLFFCFKKSEWTTKQKKINNMLTRTTKQTLKWWNQGQWNILFFSKKMFYFVDSNWENKSYTIKGAQNRACYFLVFGKTWKDMQTKKRNEMLNKSTKQTPKWWNQGQWNILFFSENKCSILSVSQLEKKVTH